MKILWLSLSPSLYNHTKKKGYNGIGWIAALEKEIRKNELFELAIAFWHTDNTFKVSSENVTYYPMKKSMSLQSKWSKLTFSNKQDDIDIKSVQKVVEDYQPDLIHIFGTESNLGLISKFTAIPTIIHLQGILNPCFNAWFPSGFSSIDLIRYGSLNPKKVFDLWWAFKNNQFMSQREIKIMQACSYYMGRTHWDEALAKLIAPNSKYYYCGEILREAFYYSTQTWSPKTRDKLIIQSTISSPLYKGLDLILKTAKILCKFTNTDFEWRVFGIRKAGVVERKLKIKPETVNVRFMGVASAEELKSSLLECDVYLHPSYIDNSPNSVCEAQILGVPVIATNVGGVSSLIKHEENGLLVPANDPYMAASYIIALDTDKAKSGNIGKEARKTALTRHDPQTVIGDLINIYSERLSNQQKNASLKHREAL